MLHLHDYFLQEVGVIRQLYVSIQEKQNFT